MDVNAEYNLGKIQERLNEIQQNILGLNTPVSKLMGEANGEVTDAKVKEFADTIISHQCNLNGCYIGISGVRKRYFELFFYLVCRAYDPQHRLHNFEDLLMIAKEMSNAYKCREELILREAGLVGGPLGFFLEIHESCMLLTERSLAHDFTEEELLKLVDELNHKKSINGILCQLPLPFQRCWKSIGQRRRLSNRKLWKGRGCLPTLRRSRLLFGINIKSMVWKDIRIIGRR